MILEDLEKQCSDFVEQASFLTDEYCKRISDLGEEFSEKVLIPFCKRRKIGFSYAMGPHGFYRNKGKGEPIMERELEDPKHYKLRYAQETIDGLKILIKTLDTSLETPADHLLGYYCHGILEPRGKAE